MRQSNGSTRRTKKADKVVTVRIKKNYRNSAEFFVMQAKKKDYRRVKEGVIPIFGHLTLELQKYYKALIATSMGVNSKTLSATTGLNGHQIGQLKRRIREKEAHIVELP